MSNYQNFKHFKSEVVAALVAKGIDSNVIESDVVDNWIFEYWMSGITVKELLERFESEDSFKIASVEGRWKHILEELTKMLSSAEGKNERLTASLQHGAPDQVAQAAVQVAEALIRSVERARAAQAMLFQAEDMEKAGILPEQRYIRLRDLAFKQNAQISAHIDNYSTSPQANLTAQSRAAAYGQIAQMFSVFTGW